MRTSSLLLLLSLAPALAGAQGNPNPVPADPSRWPQHSMERPRPANVTPGPFATVPAPSDAIVLMDGKSLAKWRATDSAMGPVRWTIANGYVEVAPGTGAIATRDSFGDVQLHIEWSSPVPAVGESQHRGNSGVFLMGRYEVQVLDSYQSKTYADGQAGALYGQYPPLVNATRKPGEWQAYDIVFDAPRFGNDGKVLRPARVTAFLNGVLIQNAQEL